MLLGNYPKTMFLYGPAEDSAALVDCLFVLSFALFFRHVFCFVPFAFLLFFSFCCLQVGGVYAAVATCTAALFWWRRRQLKDKTPPFLTSIQS